ncbi:hypothetical protein CC80DRAFT_152830 [Byssothecium circinans]|uniref:Uncharacterized protein n=1 Tax=Byssothecium circinans TaxID=147558 RepID=A0A6A5TNH7_9PLEO|nr:hypothetical protein CC80DRAFT_152830 [Byssothecium circinans]
MLITVKEKTAALHLRSSPPCSPPHHTSNSAFSNFFANDQLTLLNNNAVAYFPRYFHRLISSLLFITQSPPIHQCILPRILSLILILRTQPARSWTTSLRSSSAFARAKSPVTSHPSHPPSFLICRASRFAIHDLGSYFLTSPAPSPSKLILARHPRLHPSIHPVSRASRTS